MAVAVTQFCLFFFRLQQILGFEIPSASLLPLKLNFCNLDLNAGESTYSYVTGAPNGPQNWGNLNPNWTLCATGRRQSPINFLRSRALVGPSLGDLNIQYKPVPARLIHGGHDIDLKWSGDAGGITINGTVFKLNEAHWHVPSEHTVNGLRYSMELHFVHRNSLGNIAVVGILYKLGRADPFLKQFESYLPSVTSDGTDLGKINPSNIGRTGKEYYRYNGSLTTPPCSENVTWTVLRKLKTVSQQQIDALMNAVGDVNNTGNARPIQPLNGRPVYLFKPRASSGFSDI